MKLFWYMVNYSGLFRIVGAALRHPKLPLASIPGWSIGAAILLSAPRSGATPIDLGSAESFAILAGAGITISGATTVVGDIGIYPASTVAGLANAALTGTVHAGDTAAHAAQTALIAAYADAAGRTPTSIFAPIYDLGGQTFLPGVYHDSTSLAITGTVTLDAHGNPNAVWIFQAGTTLITSSGSQVILTGGAQAANVFWQVGTSATLGSQSIFVGDILAQQSATLNSGASVLGRILAEQGAVTLDGNSIHVSSASAPDGGATPILFGLSLAALFAFKLRQKPPALG